MAIKTMVQSIKQRRADYIRTGKYPGSDRFSKYSDASLQKAVDIAFQYEAKIHLLHVITQQVRPCAVDYCLTAKLLNQLEKESIKGAEDKLEKEANALAQKKGVNILFDIRSGISHEVILSEQKAKKSI